MSGLLTSLLYQDSSVFNLSPLSPTYANVFIVVHGIEVDLKLTSNNKPEKPPISFNLSQRSIKLRGTDKFIKSIKNFLEEQRHPKPSRAERITPMDLLCLRTRFPPISTQRP